MKTLTSILEKSSREFSNHPALTMRMGYRTVSLTYKELFEEAQKMALFLQSKGIKPGDKVLLLAPNSPYWSVVFFGCQLNGSIPVPLNIQSTEDQIKRVTDQTNAKLIIAHSYCKTSMPRSIQRHDIELIHELIEPFNVADFKSAHIEAHDIAQILYTSGTTGDPKGVVLTHANIYSNLEAISKIITIHPTRDRLLSVLPLSHILEQTIGLMLPLMYGAHIIYAHTPAAIRQLMHTYQITKMVAVPEFLHILMSRIEEQAEKKSKKKLLERMMRFSSTLNIRSFSKLLFYPIRRALSSKLDTVSSGGAFLDPELEKKWNALGIYLLQGYGLTETSPVVATNTYTQHRLGSVGKVLENVQVKLGDDGEILVKGPNVFGQYYKNEKQTKQAFTDDGWFKTGDLGEFDADGFLFIRGRKKYVIIGPGGQNVYPEDIEAQLNIQPGVIDSAVIGIERKHAVEIHAVLLLNEEVAKDPEKIIYHANQNLASYQQIGDWTIWPEIDFPRSATRKVQKEKVKTYLKENETRTQKPISISTTPLIRLISHITAVEPTQLSPSTKFRTLHLDSLMRIELVARIEEDFGIMINESDINGESTIHDVQIMIDKREGAKEPPRLKSWPRSWWAHGLRFFFQYFFYFILRLWMKLKIDGLENLQDLNGPVIFMPNHISYADPLALTMALPFKIRNNNSFAAAYDVLYCYPRPVVCMAELSFNTFPFPRREQEHIAWGLKNVGAMLDKQYNVVVYPEGKISKDGKLQELKAGAGLIAVAMDAPVIPVYVKGTNIIFPFFKFLPRARATVTVTFGKPMRFSKSEGYEKATQDIYDQMKKMV